MWLALQVCFVHTVGQVFPVATAHAALVAGYCRYCHQTCIKVHRQYVLLTLGK